MKKVVIIGATSGIGKELALLYIKAGHQVGITGRRKELLNEFKQLYPSQIFTLAFDVTGTENIPHLETLIQQLGGMDVFVYNSGMGNISKELNAALEISTTKTNVNGFLETTVYAFNYFVKQGYGQIAGISSIASYRGNSWAPSYSASKAFMSNYLEGLRIKAFKMKKKISVTDIQPGFVKTAMAKGERLFWMQDLDKAAKQIFNAIENRKGRVQITKRWSLIAVLLRWLPYFLYKKMG